MPYFESFKAIATQEIKYYADEGGYYQECFEMGYRYLYGADGCERSLDDAMRYLSSMAKDESAAYHLSAKKFYIEALLQFYIEANDNNEMATKRLNEGLQYLSDISKNDKCMITLDEEEKFFKLLTKIYMKSKNSKSIEDFLLLFSKVKKSFTASSKLANLYTHGEFGFEKKAKRAMAYYIQALFLDNNDLYSDKSIYGKSRAEYFNNVMQALPDNVTTACQCLISLALIGSSNKNSEYKEKIKAIIESALLKKYFNFEKDRYSSKYHIGSITIDLYQAEWTVNLIRLALITNPYATVSMAAACFKEDLISEEIFNKFIQQTTQKQLAINSNTYIETPGSQIDRLYSKFFAIKYTKRMPMDTALQRRLVLIELVKTLLLADGSPAKPKQYSIIAELVMELIITNHPDCIAYVVKVHKLYGDKINIAQHFKEQGLKGMIQNKQAQLNHAKLKIVTDAFNNFTEFTIKFSLNNESKMILPKAIQDLLNTLQMPANYVDPNIDVLFNKQKLEELDKFIELAKAEFTTLQNTIGHLDTFKGYLDTETYGVLINEIELAKKAIHCGKELEEYLAKFQHTLKALNDGTWKDEVVEMMEEELVTNNHHYAKKLG